MDIYENELTCLKEKKHQQNDFRKWQGILKQPGTTQT